MDNPLSANELLSPSALRPTAATFTSHVKQPHLPDTSDGLDDELPEVAEATEKTSSPFTSPFTNIIRPTSGLSRWKVPLSVLFPSSSRRDSYRALQVDDEVGGRRLAVSCSITSLHHASPDTFCIQLFPNVRPCLAFSSYYMPLFVLIVVHQSPLTFPLVFPRLSRPVSLPFQASSVGHLRQSNIHPITHCIVLYQARLPIV